MGVCDYIMIGVGNHSGRYGIRGVLERRKYIEVYNYKGSKILGSSVGVFIGISIGYSKE